MREADLGRIGVKAPALPELKIWGLVRYLVFAMLMVASLMFYTWSRIDVRASAAVLDSAIIEYSALSADAERLQLELAARRDLASVGQAGLALGLVSEVEVVNLQLGGRR
ncbi:MAG: hypothetical protein H6741_26170 [Alphaproteobacteria bacterium]|nr:hypothetical protein [Alphaproteobacteria bacterium]